MARRILSFSCLPDLSTHTHTHTSFAYFTRSRLTVWFFVTRLLTGLEQLAKRDVSPWASASPPCVSGGFAIQLKRFVWYIGRAMYPVLRAGWLNVCRTHGPAILSSSLIVPTAALNHIYLSGNQAASTMEAVHLSRRVPPFDARRARGDEKTRNHRPFGQSYFAITLIAVPSSSRGCLFARANRKIANCLPLRDRTRLSRVVIDFSLLTQFNYGQDNWINPEPYYVCRRRLS